MNPALSRMTPFLAMDVAERARKLEADGIDVVHLETGEPDGGVHPLVVRAAHEALDERRTHYTDAFGDADLRAAICRLYRLEYGVTVTPDRVMVTGGSSPALLMVLQALLDAGDEVLVTNPGYPCYRDFVYAAHGVPVSVDVDAASRFQPSAERLAAAVTPRTRALFINSPSNPAGTMLDEKALGEIAAAFPAAHKNEPVVISDEIYHGLVAGGGRARTILEYTDNAFVINGFSKRFGMTGLRVGYVIMPKAFVRILRILQQNLFICAGSIAQRAALAALRLLLGEHPQSDAFRRDLAAQRAEYDRRREFMVARIRDLGLTVPAPPEGAFYVFADARRYTRDSASFVANALDHARVGITPGTDFGPGGQGYLRFSYTAPVPRIREAFNRLAEA